MRMVPAKVGTIPITIDLDLLGEDEVKVGARVRWRKFVPNEHYTKFSGGVVTEVIGDPANPSMVFIDRR